MNAEPGSAPAVVSDAAPEIVIDVHGLTKSLSLIHIFEPHDLASFGAASV